jgi:hypothetical protein
VNGVRSKIINPTTEEIIKGLLVKRPLQVGIPKQTAE